MQTITQKDASAISSHSHSQIRILVCCPVDKSWILYSFHILKFAYFSLWQKIMLISLHSAQSKYAIIHYHEIPSKSLNVLEFFCVPLYTEFLTDLYKKFQVASVHDTNVDYQIWRYCCNLFLSYADKKALNFMCVAIDNYICILRIPVFKAGIKLSRIILFLFK